MRDGQLEAWALTLVVEGIVAALLARPFGVKPLGAAAAGVIGSLFSHPIVWWLHFRLVDDVGYWGSFAIVESFAWASEAPFYRVLARAPWGRAILLSLIVNASSVLAGFAVYYYAPQWLA